MITREDPAGGPSRAAAGLQAGGMRKAPKIFRGRVAGESRKSEAKSKVESRKSRSRPPKESRPENPNDQRRVVLRLARVGVVPFRQQIPLGDLFGVKVLLGHAGRYHDILLVLVAVVVLAEEDPGHRIDLTLLHILLP